MLTLTTVTKTYGRGVTALRDVDLVVERGDFAIVRGPSGCGKTTLLLTAGAMLRPTSGTVTIDGVDPYATGAGARARFRAMRIGFVFQSIHLLPYLSLLDNVRVAKREGATDPRELLERLDLGDRLDHRPGELSAGERQRGAVARALVNDPQLVLADEPTGNLDAASGAAVLDALEAYRTGGGTVVLVTHQTHDGPADARHVRLDAGRLAENAST